MGKKDDWLNYFRSVNGREPTQAEIDAAKALWEEDAAPADGATSAVEAEQQSQSPADEPSQSAPTEPQEPTAQAQQGQAQQPQDSASQNQPAAAQPIGYDPQTGAPVYAQADRPQQTGGQQPSGYDPQTGQPVYGQPAQQVAGVVTPVGGRPLDQLISFFTSGAWRTKDGWAASIDGQRNLGVTLALFNVLIGCCWLFSAAKVGTLKKTWGQIYAVLKSFGATSSLDSATSGKLSQFSSNMNTLNVLTWGLAIVLILVGANALLQLVKFSWEPYLLTGTSAVSLLASAIMYYALHVKIGGAKIDGSVYTINDYLAPLAKQFNGTASTATSGPAQQIASFLSEFKEALSGLYTTVIGYLKNIVNAFYGFERMSLVIAIVSLVLTGLAVYGITKGWGKQQNG